MKEYKILSQKDKWFTNIKWYGSGTAALIPEHIKMQILENQIKK